jgi:hypothetical protein
MESDLRLILTDLVACRVELLLPYTFENPEIVYAVTITLNTVWHHSLPYSCE